MEYLILLSKPFEDCGHYLNKMGIVTYKFNGTNGLIGFWSKLSIDYLSQRDFIQTIEKMYD